MSKQLKLPKLILALLFTVSVMVLSSHNYSHAQTEFSSCQLCIHHGNTDGFASAEPHAFVVVTVPNFVFQIQQPQIPSNTDLYHQPSRGPPLAA
jgi:hypothetical protein